MREQEMVQWALEQGFAAAAVLDTDKIIFDPLFRRYCEENLCGQYNANYSCPPSCGSPEEMKRRLLQHRRALVMQSVWDIADYSDENAIHRAQEAHNAVEFRVVEALKAQGHDGVLVGSSGCRLCDPCQQALGQPCRYPHLRYSCMSAYCIFVKALAEACGIPYDYGAARMGLFGLYAFD